MRCTFLLIALAAPAAAHADGDRKPHLVADGAIDRAEIAQAASGTGPAAPPEAPVAFAPPLLREPVPAYSPVAIGLVPGLSTDLTHIGSVQHFVSLHLLAGVGGGSSGLSLSGIADIERGPVTGYQVGGVIAAAPRIEGTQLAGVAAVAGDVHGVQLAGATAVARADADVQIAGVLNVARRTSGLQLAALNVARQVDGAQVGAINIGGSAHGAQVGAINIGGAGDGVQVGVINIGGSPDGFSLGLINIVPGGRRDLETSIDSSKLGTLLFRHGSRRWHNVYGVGGQPVDHSGPSDDVWMYGLGFGHTVPLGDSLLDLEAIGWHVNHGPHYETDVSILAQLRLSFASQLGPFAIVAGGNLNVYVAGDPHSPLLLEHRDADTPMTGTAVAIWPSAFVGLRI